ncbi:MAG: cytochrome C oxidase subunit IV family protein [Planctomycetaceae bacterium]|nr:cytochrome C oxidase subunit IV family protein [Planctomycetaceae bacterium]
MTDHAHAEDHGDAGHVMPPSILIGTFLALVGLTILTVGSSYFPLGSIELFVAMGIATVKAGLVAVYFMHLRYDKPLNALLLIFSLGFVALFICLTLIDSQSYQADIQAVTAP